MNTSKAKSQDITKMKILPKIIHTPKDTIHKKKKKKNFTT